MVNAVIGGQRIGSGLKVDDIKPITGTDENGRPFIVQEFPGSAQAHGFTDIVDNYAGYATKFSLNNGANLYQVEGSLNGISGRFEWIVDDGNVTHRMFVQGGTVNGVPIK